MIYTPYRRQPRSFPLYFLGESVLLVALFLAMVGSLRVFALVQELTDPDRRLDRGGLPQGYLPHMVLCVYFPLGLGLAGVGLVIAGLVRGWRKKPEAASEESPESPPPFSRRRRVGVVLRFIGDFLVLLALLQALRGSLSAGLMMRIFSLPGAVPRPDMLAEGLANHVVEGVVIPIFAGLLGLFLLATGIYLSLPSQPQRRYGIHPSNSG